MCVFPAVTLGVITDYETAVGHVFGLEPSVPRATPSSRTPLDVLGDVLEPHLAAGPCLIWQTGDDGGALGLVAAVRRARREGLPDPIPLTLVTQPGAGDDPHVQAVVDATGLREWARVDATEGLDLLGPDARAALLRHGLRYPSIGHVVAPAARAAAGGTVVDCHGLREVWDFWRGTAARRVLAGMRRDRRALAASVLAFTPKSVRRRAVAPHARAFVPDHVTPPVGEWLYERFVEEQLSMPLSASGAVRELHQRRCLWETARTFTSVGADHGATVVHFFMEPAVVGALAGVAGRFGWPTPAALVTQLAPELPARSTPPPRTPREPFWAGPESTEFIDAWDGSGLDETLVYPERVRAAWRRKDARAGLLLQAAWLASAGATRERSGAAAVPAAE